MFLKLTILAGILLSFSHSPAAWAGSSAGGASMAYGSGSAGSGELRMPCGGIYMDCATALDLIKNKILSNAYETAFSLVENHSLPKSISDSGNIQAVPFPKVDSQHVCPLVPFKISYKKIINSETSPSEEKLGSEVQYGCDKSVGKADFVAKCGDIKYSMFDGALGSAVAGGAPVAYSAAAKDVVNQVSVVGSEIVFKFTTANCNSAAITDRFKTMVAKLQGLANKEDIANKCGAGVTDKARGLCSTRHFLSAGYNALTSGMSQMGACEIHDKAMSKYEAYKKTFNAAYRKATQSACAVVKTGQPQSEVDKCFSDSMHDRIQTEQAAIGGQPC